MCFSNVVMFYLVNIVLECDLSFPCPVIPVISFSLLCAIVFTAAVSLTAPAACASHLPVMMLSRSPSWTEKIKVQYVDLARHG